MVVVCFMLEQMNNNTDFKDIIQEVKALSCLEHERIPKLYGMLYNKDKCYIFMELVKGTSANAIYYLQVLI